MITQKDLKLSCIGFRGYDDEWHPDSRYEDFLKVENHHYHIKIWKVQKNKWFLRIHLCLTAINSDDVFFAEHSAKTMRELKQLAITEINNYHDSSRCTNDIKEWKGTHGKKVFDSNYNYLGISYTNPERETHNQKFDYYNEEKPCIGYGTYYMLEAETVMVCKIGCGWSSISYDNSSELRERILAKISELGLQQ